MNDSTAELQFQEAAVQRIIAALTNKNGSRRFLLADEVGLGKTVVAAGVVRELLKSKRRKQGKPFSIVYLCSSNAIAAQNAVRIQRRIAETVKVSEIKRLSLYPKDSTDASNYEAVIYAFTPGTSLTVGNRTGRMEERRLLLYMLGRRLGWNTLSLPFFRYFVSSVQTKQWNRKKFRETLSTEFRGRIDKEFFNKWTSRVDKLTAELSVLPPGDAPVNMSLLKAVRSLNKKHSILGTARSYTDRFRKNRNTVIGALRESLALAALHFIEPDLIIMDEFHRFKHILENAGKADTIEHELLSNTRRKIPTLILSATPYKMLSFHRDREDDHYRDLMDSFQFLFGGTVAAKSKDKSAKNSAALDDNYLDQVKTLKKELDRRKSQLNEYVRLFVAAEQDSSKRSELDVLFDDLMKGKKIIEGSTNEEQTHAGIQSVMSRTERSRYASGTARGVEENVTGQTARSNQGILSNDYPTKEDLLQYFHLRNVLLKDKQTARIHGSHVVEYWKTASSVLSFMDDSYKLTRRNRLTNRDIPSEVQASPEKLKIAYRRNFKLRQLMKALFGDEKGLATKSLKWKYLWLRPTILAYDDAFFFDPPPKKMLVFSHWRFAPQAISYFVNSRLTVGLKDTQSLRRAKLEYTGESVSSTFLLTFPSHFAATVLDFNQLVGDKFGVISLAELRQSAKERIKEALLAGGVSFGKQGKKGIRPYQLIARLDQAFLQDQHTEILRNLDRKKNKGNGDNKAGDLLKKFRHEFNWYLDEGDCKESLKVSSEKEDRLLDEITDILLFSPANILLRSLLRTNGTVESQHAAQLFSVCGEAVAKTALFCAEELRVYFEREWSRYCVEHGTPRTKSGYWRKVIDYCGLAHFQEVMDEFLYVAASDFSDPTSSGGKSTSSRFDQIFELLTSVFGHHSSNPRIVFEGVPHPKPRSFPNLAIDFGGQATTESTNGSTRRASNVTVREAFNSPFWPFVLATTSRGQEGLDFHLYCREIVHWNLPTNPVDLEQREGRLDRYNSLAIRQSIAEHEFSSREQRDRLLASLQANRRNTWANIFDLVKADPLHPGKFKHDLFPHWIHQPSTYSNEESSKAEATIRRNVFAYANSKDVVRYRNLTRMLAIYRLAFGQANQEDFLNDLLKQKEQLSDAARARLDIDLNSLMINLSPVDSAFVAKISKLKATELINERCPGNLHRLLAQVRELAMDSALVNDMGESESKLLIDQIHDLVSHVETSIHSNQAPSTTVVAALVHFVNPFDVVFDDHHCGFDDDREAIRAAHASLDLKTNRP